MEKKYLDLSVKRLAEMELLIKELDKVKDTTNVMSFQPVKNRVEVKQAQLFE